MIPELPRAPIKAPWAKAASTSRTPASADSPDTASTAASKVR